MFAGGSIATIPGEALQAYSGDAQIAENITSPDRDDARALAKHLRRAIDGDF